MADENKGVDTVVEPVTTTPVETKKASDDESPMDFDDPTLEVEVPDEGEQADESAAEAATSAAPTPEPTPAEKPAETPAPKVETPPEKSLVDDIPDLDPEVYEEGLVKTVSTLKAVAKQLEAQNKTLLAERTKESTTTFFDTFDDVVTGLNVPEFGTGRRIALKPEHQTARMQILEEMSVITEGRKAKGLPELPVADLVKRAVGAIKPDALTKAPRSSQGIARPSKSGTSTLTPEQRAIRAVRAKMGAMAEANDDGFL